MTNLPPQAPQVEHVHVDVVDGEVVARRADPYAWMRDRDDERVVAHLESENAYTQARMGEHAELVATLLNELDQRVVLGQDSLAAPWGGHEYLVRGDETSDHQWHIRRPRGGGEDEVLLDENVLAAGSAGFVLGVLDISPGEHRMVVSWDMDGSELYQMEIWDIKTKDVLLHVEDVCGGGVFGDDDTIFFLRNDTNLRPYQVWRQSIGTDAELVLQEDDDNFCVSVEVTRDGEALLICSGSPTTTEYYHVPTSDLTKAPVSLTGREDGVLHTIDHHQGRGTFLDVTNQVGDGFDLVETTLHADETTSSVMVLTAREGVRLTSADCFSGGVVLGGREMGTTILEVIDLDTLEVRRVEPPERDLNLELDVNMEYDTSTIRVSYTSLVTPPSILTVDLTTMETELVWQETIQDYDPEQYVTERLWAPTQDGEVVPMSVVRHKDTPRDGTAPGVIYAYGAYETCMDPWFSTSRVSLLDRGVVFALAHVRGGGEMGRSWWEQGKMLKKTNTFDDVVACTEYLTKEDHVRPGRVALRGGSAGGLMVGAVMNRHGHLYEAMVAEVPFVDVVTTMQDPTLPLVIGEWEEWGNPLTSTLDHANMLSYSPYDNVDQGPYPPLFVTAGLNDPRVGYWEPAKWVARIRERAGSEVLLRTDMEAGHGGTTSRTENWLAEAEVLAFMLTRLQVS